MRAYDFGTGTTIIPKKVVETLQNDLSNYQMSGLSVLELNFRSGLGQNLLAETEEAFRRVLRIPEEYGVLVLAGSHILQHAQIPMNLMRNSRADFLLTGRRAEYAKAEADKVGIARVVASSSDTGFDRIPDTTRAMFDPSADYVHLVLDNAAQGTSFLDRLPDVGDVMLVADASNCLFFDEIDISRYGLIYADAMSVLGAPGLTLVIMRRDLVRKDPPMSMPAMLSYKRLLEGSIPTYSLPVISLLVCKRMLEQMEREGGLASIGRRNREKAARVYDVLDNSRFYQPTAHVDSRSNCSIVFRLPDETLRRQFLAQSGRLGFVGLNGPMDDGSICLSACNSMNEDGMASMLDFLSRFQKENR